MTNLAQALLLAERGYLCFALNSGGKPYANCDECRTSHFVTEDYEVCDCLLCHGTYAGTDDPEQLTEMWAEHPDALVGIRTGEASGFFCLDFDQHDGGKDGMATLRSMKDAGVLPQTVTALTGGAGVHLFYRYPSGLRVPNENKGKLGAGVDVKGDGGFVIAPPSKKFGKKAYRWYPGRSPEEQSLAEASPAVLAVIAAVRQPQRVRTATGFQVDLSAVTLKDFRDALDRLEWTGQGNRNGRLYEAACRGGEAVAAGALALAEVKASLEEYSAKAGMNYREDGVPGTIRSGLHRGMQDYRETL
jgi:hypothetical protein